MRIGIRHKLIILSALVIVVVSTGLTWANLLLARRAIEEDFKSRAILYAREVAISIGDRAPLEPEPVLRRIGRLIELRRTVLQLDVIAFSPEEITTVVASSRPETLLAFTRDNAEEVRAGRLVSRFVKGGAGERHWEILAPITLEGQVAGAVAVKFSTQRGDELAARIRFWAFALTALSVALMGLLMSGAIHLVVDRPLRRFMDSVSRAADDGVPSPVWVATGDEFGVLARHYNEMVERIARFNDELRTRIAGATDELDRRYRQVEQLNALLFEMQRRLGHAERLALSGRVMAEVAHEVGTPLHSVAGHLELLRKDLPPSVMTPDIERRLTIIEAQLRRVIEIIERLLDVTRRVPAEPRPVDLARLARDTADLVRPGLASAGLTLEVNGDPALPAVLGQHDQLQQVILNLLTNAMAATPTGGRVQVTTRARAGDVEIAVADTGRGVSLADRERIFEPFFSTKEPPHGTGLGLFITSQIVREHKGQMEVESEEGTGSTFRVILPAAGPVR
jgi:signal transduction histidine kinase